MSEHKVLPCPFCGFADVEIGEVDLGCFAVDCPECGCIGPIVQEDKNGFVFNLHTEGLEAAIAEWNKAPRPQP